MNEASGNTGRVGFSTCCCYTPCYCCSAARRTRKKAAAAVAPTQKTQTKKAKVMLGVASGLECISCTWDTANATVDDDCLGAPFKTGVKTCTTDSDKGTVNYCQTQATFVITGGVKSLESLERFCDLKHSRCNNACADDTTICYLCCNDVDKCNGFPLRANNVVVTANTASVVGLKIVSTVLLIIIALLLP